MNDIALLYILDENDNPIPVEDTKEGVLKWGEFFQDFKRRQIRVTEIEGHTVYTNFLGANTNMGKFGRPLLWGTAVKRNRDGKWIEDHEFDTKEEAIDCHKKLIHNMKSKEKGGL